MSTRHPSCSVLRRAVATMRHDGLVAFWFKLLSAGGCRRLLVLARALDEETAQPPAQLPLEIGLLDESELDEYLALRPDAIGVDILKRLQSGHMCFVARHEGRIVSVCWSATQLAWSDFLGCEIDLMPGDVYLFDAFTQPAYRGRDIAPALCGHQLRYFGNAHFRRAIRCTSPENEPALRAHRKSGFRPVGMLRTITLGPWRRVFRRTN